MAGQLQVIMLILDDIVMECEKVYTVIESETQDVTNGCIPIFQQYLAERTQETVKAFSEAGDCGRCFALRVYGGKAEVRQ